MTRNATQHTMTLEQATQAENECHGWVRRHGPLISLSAMLVTGAGEIADIPEPHGFVIGSLGDMSEAEIALLLVQLETFLLVTLASVAGTAAMGEEAFRSLYLKYRKIMMQKERVEVCPDCEQEFPRLTDGRPS